MAQPVAVLNGRGTTPAGNSASLVQELAAVSFAVLDKRVERTRYLTTVNADIKALERRLRDLAAAVRQGGIQIGLELFPESAAVLQRSPQAVKDEQPEE